MNAAATAMEAVWWTRELFSSGEGQTDVCPPCIDITGAMRVLVFGPMQILSGGRWRVSARFALNDDAARYPFILQFVHGDSLVEERIQPTSAGAYEVSLENTFELDAVAAIRFWLAAPAFHGDLQFFGAFAQKLRADETVHVA